MAAASVTPQPEKSVRSVTNAGIGWTLVRPQQRYEDHGADEIDGDFSTAQMLRPLDEELGFIGDVRWLSVLQDGE
jgi:hypothetical protein